MIFYLVHRLILTGSGTYGGLRGFSDLTTSYIITGIMLVLLYPFCLWYRGMKARNSDIVWLRYF